MHRHKAVRAYDKPWTHCVCPSKCNGAAHGNIIRIEVCECGAVRQTEINGTHILPGPWVLHGWPAIEEAEKAGRLLSKYRDPVEGPREGLTVDEARLVAREDPSLIYLPQHC